MAVQRLVGGLLPGFRSGSFPAAESSAPTYTQSHARANPAERPLLARRTPLTSKTSVLSRTLVSTPKDAVVGGSTAHLAMAPPPGAAGISADQRGAEAGHSAAQHLSVPSPAAVVQRAASSIVVAPIRSLVRSIRPKTTGGVTAAVQRAAAFGQVTQSPGPMSAVGPATASLRAAAEQSSVVLPGVAAQPLTGQPLTAPQFIGESPAAGFQATQSPATRSAPVRLTAVQPLVARRSLSPTTPDTAGRSAPYQSPAASFPPVSIPVWLPTAAPEVAERPASPEQRWRAAIASVPLESPKPFPSSVRPLVAQLTGSPDGASYTTGHATRRALHEVGALGATTGRVVHLAQQPGTDPAGLGVLAHELTHARSPVTRPRFMLHHHTGSMDSDERHARTVGSQFDAVAPTRVQRLFGGGLPSPSGVVGGLTNQATGAIGGLGNQVTGMVGGMAGTATSAIGSGASELSSAAGGMSERFASAASGFANRMGDEAGSVSAGLVDSLPVGGGANGVVGAVSQIARTVVDNAVREATQSAMSEANQAVSQATQAAQGVVGQLQGMATDGVNGVAGQANQWVNSAMTQAGGAVQDLGNQAMGAVGDAQNAVSGAANQAMNQAAGALGPGAQQALSGVDLDRIAEALEERLLRQLERRGGRYAGVF
ncbi:hypothetical protein ALI144C_38360 [Actinosynnema sp. ALI-1.44]|uniref:eCIS core domain-containing protein n=1 Tax=Actinosynnema sp. ALI-1.44 TaxID=1933779 RepID=UPI00097BE53C|nr:DUF4157 domain-containing protein [Actinosynnema sp. ALI-1.44]ONI74690.1 hypothetical protein ALI144C_38360 [Actinosynnema sp. ALI-1.44]